MGGVVRGVGAGANATCLTCGAGSSAVAAVPLVGVEVVAPAIALIAPGFALTLAVLALGARATVVVPGTVLADLLAGSHHAGAEQQS